MQTKEEIEKARAQEEALAGVKAQLGRVVDMPALLSSRGYSLSPGCTGEAGVEMTKQSDKLTLTKGEDGGWRFQAPDGSTGGSGEVLVRGGVPEKAVIDKLFALSQPKASRDPEVLAYHSARLQKPAELTQAEKGYAWARDVEMALNRRLDGMGIRPETLDERFRKLTPEALLREPEQVWWSKPRPSDRTVVLVERPIDGVAHATLTKRQDAVYVAIGSSLAEGAPGKDEREGVVKHLLAAAAGVNVVVAFGASRSGEELAARVRELAPAEVRQTMTREPPRFGERWSEQLAMEKQHAKSVRPALERAQQQKVPGLQL